MDVTFFQTVIMYNLSKLQGERTIYAIFHLLQGKRSSQTIQDAHLYQLTPFFHSFAPITRAWLEKTIDQLIEEKLAEEIAESRVKLTAQGMRLLEMKLQETPFPRYLSGWKYHQVTDLFWERLTILVQVCSNLVYRQRGYVPVRNKRETLKWVKDYIRKQEEDRYILSRRLYNELVSALDNPYSKPEYVVMRLTGAKEIGLTAIQAAEKAGIEPVHYHFEFLNGIHGMFKRMEDAPDHYPLLYGLLEQTPSESPLTHSSEKTFRLLEKGYSVEEIAAVRNLKDSTIEDHLVEIALSTKDFNINRYLSPDKQQRILAASGHSSAKKLKEIRERVGDASYFEIRLVLAKFGGAKWT